jgi:hypothetical protein
MGVLESAGKLSKGIEVITPAVIESPLAASISAPTSKEPTEDLLECRDEREPDELPANPGGSNDTQLFSERSSEGFSLCSFFPKNDLLADDCLDLSGEDIEVGMSTRIAWTAHSEA